MSEEDYNSLIETLYIESIPNLKKEIIQRAKSSDEEFINALEENLYPIYKSAMSQGFSIWAGPTI